MLLLTSFAKALGAPVGALGGSPELIERYRSGADTRVHCSPVSVAAVRALEHALVSNRDHGERLRWLAARAVVRFRRRLGELGVHADGGSLPVQALPQLPPQGGGSAASPPARPRDLRRSAELGSRALRGAKCSYSTARTTDADVDAACEAVARAPQLELLRRDRRDRAAA